MQLLQNGNTAIEVLLGEHFNSYQLYNGGSQ